MVILPPAPVPLTPVEVDAVGLGGAAGDGGGPAVGFAIINRHVLGASLPGVPGAGAAAWQPCRSAPSPLGASPLVISASGLPTSIVSSGPTRILVIVPQAGAGTSASTLSVETSTTVSPSSIGRPRRRATRARSPRSPTRPSRASRSRGRRPPATCRRRPRRRPWSPCDPLAPFGAWLRLRGRPRRRLHPDRGSLGARLRRAFILLGLRGPAAVGVDVGERLADLDRPRRPGRRSS